MPVEAILRAVWEPLEFAFLRDALLAAVAVAVVSGVVGTFTVVRGMAFFADAVAHAVVPGVAVAFLWAGGGEALFWGALAGASVAAAAVHAVQRGGKVQPDTAIGVVMAAALAVGVAIISTRRTYAVDLAHVLFGNILGVTRADLVRLALSGAAVVGATLVMFRPLSLVAFDPVLAATLGIRVAWVEYAAMALVALAAVLALQTVGVTLTLAALVTPAASARLVARRIGTMMAWAVAFSVAAAVVGVYGSYYLSIPSGPAIVVALTAIFAGARLAARS